MPESFEWVAEITPALRSAAEAAGLHVGDYLLLALPPGALRPAATRPEVTLRLVTPDDDDLARIGAVGPIAFSSPVTGLGPPGMDALDALQASSDADSLAF